MCVIVAFRDDAGADVDGRNVQSMSARERVLCMDDHRASCVATSSAVATHGWRQRRVRSPVHEYAETSKLSTSSFRNAATSTFSEPAWLPNGNLRGTAPGVSTTAAAYSALVKAKPATQGARHQRARLRSRSSSVGRYVGFSFAVTMRFFPIF